MLALGAFEQLPYVVDVLFALIAVLFIVLESVSTHHAMLFRERLTDCCIVLPVVFSEVPAEAGGSCCSIISKSSSYSLWVLLELGRILATA